MIFGIIVFPGSNAEKDCAKALSLLGQQSDLIWHNSNTDITQYHGIIIPGGFSYGDYLRPGALAAQSPITSSLKQYAVKGGFILGIGNGFQILTEMKLLAGAFLPNHSLKFLERNVNLRVENQKTALARRFKNKQIINIPFANGAGTYYINQEGLNKLNDKKQIVFRYAQHEKNNSTDNIAAIMNEKGNVFGLMGHPERGMENILGAGEDGRLIMASVLDHLLRRWN